LQGIARGGVHVKAFVDWVLSKRLHPVVLAIVAAPLLPVVSASLIALVTARRGITAGVFSGAATIVGLLLLGLLLRTQSAGTEPAVFASMGLICAGSGLGIGALIRRAGHLVLAYQAAMLICLVAVAAVTVVGLDVRHFFEPAIRELVALVSNELPPEQVAFIEERSVTVLLATAVFSQVIGALLLGYWWAVLAAGQRRFGQEFRRLALGRSLGIAATALIGLGLVFDSELVQNLTPLALFGFLLQGVAVLHAWAHAKRWHPGLLAPLYLLMLMPPLNVLVVLPLSMVGLVDQWFDLRASLRPQT
jgi:hypothetical protein